VIFSFGKNLLEKIYWKKSTGKNLLEKAGDPKPSELAMARVSAAEKRQEARTREPFNTLG